MRLHKVDKLEYAVEINGIRYDIKSSRWRRHFFIRANGIIVASFLSMKEVKQYLEGKQNDNQ